MVWLSALDRVAALPWCSTESRQWANNSAEKKKRGQASSWQVGVEKT